MVLRIDSTQILAGGALVVHASMWRDMVDALALPPEQVETVTLNTRGYHPPVTRNGDVFDEPTGQWVSPESVTDPTRLRRIDTRDYVRDALAASWQRHAGSRPVRGEPVDRSDTRTQSTRGDDPNGYRTALLLAAVGQLLEV